MPTYIDVHTHGMHAERDATGKLVPPVMPLWKPGDSEAGLERAHELGIETTVLLDPPEVAFSLAEDLPTFCIAAPQVYMDESSPTEIHSFFDRGARGIKFIAPMHPYGDNRYMPLYKAVLERDGAAVFHTGFLGHGMFDPGMFLGRPDHIDITHMRPATLDRIGRALPDLKILMAHFGNPWWEEAWTVMKSNANLYADLSGGTAISKSIHMWRDLFAPNGELHVKSIRKLCYASDGSPLLPGDRSAERFTTYYQWFYEQLNVPEEIQQQINCENAKMLFNLS